MNKPVEYYYKLADLMNENSLDLETEQNYILPLNIFGCGGNFTPSRMESFVLTHPNSNAIKMIYEIKENEFVVFIKKGVKVGFDELETAFQFMLRKSSFVTPIVKLVKEP